MNAVAHQTATDGPQAAKTRRGYRYMLEYASALLHKLAPVCERVEVAGSLRREKQTVHDIELVAIPYHDMDLYGEKIVTACGPLNRLLDECPIAYEKNGHRYKRFHFSEKHDPNSLIHVDLFLTTPEQWGYIFMLRTGSADFSRRMVTPKARGGFMPAGIRVEKGNVYRNGAIVPVPSEATLFALWGMPFIHPKERN